MLCVCRREDQQARKYPFKFESESGMIEFLRLRNYFDYDVPDALSLTKDLLQGQSVRAEQERRTAPALAAATTTPLTMAGAANGTLAAFSPLMQMPRL